MASGLTPKYLIHFEFLLYMVLDSVLISFFYMKLSSVPDPTCRRDCRFSMVESCLLGHRLIDQSIGVYFWAFCPAPLTCVSGLGQYHAALITVALWCSLELGSKVLPTLFFLYQGCFGYSGSFVFLYKFWNFLY